MRPVQRGEWGSILSPCLGGPEPVRSETYMARAPVPMMVSEREGEGVSVFFFVQPSEGCGLETDWRGSQCTTRRSLDLASGGVGHPPRHRRRRCHRLVVSVTGRHLSIPTKVCGLLSAVRPSVGSQRGTASVPRVLQRERDRERGCARVWKPLREPCRASGYVRVSGVIRGSRTRLVDWSEGERRERSDRILDLESRFSTPSLPRVSRTRPWL